MSPVGVLQQISEFINRLITAGISVKQFSPEIHKDRRILPYRLSAKR